MSDSVDKARNNLTISGYQHPNVLNSSFSKKVNVYQTFNSEGLDKNYTSSKQPSKYTKFSTENQKSCPSCNKPAVFGCDCKYKDNECENNHIWFIDEKGTTQIGDPHQKK